MRRAAIYTRISLDQTGEGLGVTRQEEDARAIAADRGWDIVDIWSDNSISASDKTKVRPGYDALIAAYDAGRFDALIVWDLDRLTRQPRQLEDWIDRAEQHGLAIVTTNGEADLTTDAGRLFARIKAAVARAEVERKSARQKRAELQRAQAGKPRGRGIRLTGYQVDGSVIDHEAAIVRRIFAEYAAGMGVNAIADGLTRDGIPTRTPGKPWSYATIKTILTNPRYAGRVVYDGRVLDGVDAEWEAIIDPVDFDHIQAIFDRPERRAHGAGNARKHLGSGIYRCGLCGAAMHQRSSGSYTCRGHLSRMQRVVDPYVSTVLVERLRRPDIRDLLAAAEPDIAPLVDEAERIRKRIAATEAEFLDDLIDARLYRMKADKLTSGLAAVTRQIDASRTDLPVDVLSAPDPGQAFLDADLAVRRQCVVALMESVVLHKNSRGKRFEPDTVTITWRQWDNAEISGPASAATDSPQSGNTRVPLGRRAAD